MNLTKSRDATMTVARVAGGGGNVSAACPILVPGVDYVIAVFAIA